MTTNPYVGPRAFLPGEKLPARDREMRDLADLLIAERVVLLHSPSGAGKTSLIQAGVTQRLQEEQFRPTSPLRVNSPTPEDRTVHNRYVYSIALGLLPERDPEELQPLTFPQVLEIAGQQLPSEFRVLIFDQFEEILTLNPTDWENQRTFFKELGTVLASSPIWALFSMREDYIGGLDRFVRYLPGQLRTTYRLDLLEAAAAKVAIQEPAADQGVAFRDEAADELVRRLRRAKVQRASLGTDEVEGPYVVPFQLQVVCLELWQSLSKKKRDKFDSIEVSDIEKYGDTSKPLRRYYSDIVRRVAMASKADESAIRGWFETKLITEQQFRSQTTTGPSSGEADPQEILTALQNAYLIRSDTRAGTQWYELSHDQLIEPVLQSNNTWWGKHLEPWQLTARQWNDNHSDSLLLSGADLRAAESYARTAQPTELEREFLEASAGRQKRLVRVGGTVGLIVLVALVELGVIILLLVLLLEKR